MKLTSPDIKGHIFIPPTIFPNRYYPAINNFDLDPLKLELFIRIPMLAAYQMISYDMDEDLSYYYCFLVVCKETLIFSDNVFFTPYFFRNFFGMPPFDPDKEDMSWWYDSIF